MSEMQITTSPAPVATPAGFWIRVLAAFVDGIILFILELPFAAIYYGASGKFKIDSSTGLPESMDASSVGIMTALYFLFSMVIKFFYYGAFYKAKGATPGKKMVGIQVVRRDTGAFLTYSETFLREFIGKSLCSLTFGIGYFMVGLRSDKRGLHDLISGTVVREVKN